MTRLLLLSDVVVSRACVKIATKYISREERVRRERAILATRSGSCSGLYEYIYDTGDIIGERTRLLLPPL